MIWRYGSRTHDDFRPERLQHVALVFADLVGADEHAAISLALGNERQADPGVPARRLDDGATGLDPAVLFSCLDHPKSDPVLDRPPGVEVFDFGQNRRRDVRADPSQPHQRGVAHQVDDVVVEPHGRSVGRAAAGRPGGARVRYVAGIVSARTARRIATTAAYGGGGVGLVGAGFYGLLRLQAELARRAIGQPPDDPPLADGRYGHFYAASISLLVLGDSSAAGVGVDIPEQTPGALIAAGLAQIAQRPVQLTVVARTAARTSDLAGQIRQAADTRPDLAVVMVGANDVTHRVRPTTSVRLLDEAVRRLRELGTAVVVCTCPDLGTVEPIPHPLRWVARRASRRLAAAQTIAAVEAGARTVSVGSILGPEFAAQPGNMFSPDRFHPSPAGYAAAAAAVLPSAASALQLSTEEEERPEALRGDEVLPVSEAAVEAAAESGTEVVATQVGGHDRGSRGRWAQLRHRRRRPLPEPEREDAGDMTTSRLRS
jgi:lysophospholipase L1-like esterase